MKPFKDYLEEALLIMENKIYTYDELDNIVKEMNKEIKAKFLNISISTLGGKDNASVGIKLSLDEKEKWPNKIFQNSRHATFMLDSDGTLELLTKHYRAMPKFRKAKAKNPKDAINKINKYIEKAKLETEK